VEIFAAKESEGYRQLMGGSVKADMKLLATRPVEAVTSLASNNRTRWSMMVAVLLVACPVIGIFMLIVRAKRRKRW